MNQTHIESDTAATPRVQPVLLARPTAQQAKELQTLLYDDCHRDHFYEMGRVIVPSTTTVSKSICMMVVVIGLLGNFSEGSYHGCFSTTPSWSARASNLPISSPSSATS